jgi:ubiquinone/menaquinone biosynthesis C-methylase UbiE
MRIKILILILMGAVGGHFPGFPPLPAAVPTRTSALPSTDEKQTEQVPAKKPDVFFVPTPSEAVEKMLEMAGIQSGDILYDLGCGDGRIVVTAAKKYGIRAVGVDVDPERIRESLENARTNRVEHLVTIKQADIFELDFSEATVVTLFLLPELNTRLKPQLRKLKPGSRILSYSFEMHRAKPDEVFRGKLDHEFGRAYTIFKWVVPWVEE